MPWLLIILGGLLFMVGKAWTSRREWVQLMAPILRAQGLPEEAVRLALAHAGLETSFGTEGSSDPEYSNNFWNITAGSSWKGATLEGADRDAFGKPIVQAWRVYPTPTDAARDYLALLSWSHYQAARAALLSGDVEAFVYELHAAGYFKAEPSGYLVSVKARLLELETYL